MSVLSLRKLKKAQQAVNDDSHFRHLGNIDVKMGAKVGKPTFLVSFDGFTCHSVEQIAVRVRGKGRSTNEAGLSALSHINSGVF